MTTQPTVNAIEKKNIGYSAIDLATTAGVQQWLGGFQPTASVLVNVDWINAHKDATQKFVTAIVARWDPLYSVLSWVNCGHPPPLLYRAATKKWSFLESSGPVSDDASNIPLGIEGSCKYEQFDVHSHYGRLPNARRRLQPSPRLGLEAGDYDEWEILSGLVAGLGGAFLKEERALVDELRADDLPAGSSLLEQYQQRRSDLLQSRGFDVSGLDVAQMTSVDGISRLLFPPATSRRTSSSRRVSPCGDAGWPPMSAST